VGYGPGGEWRDHPCQHPVGYGANSRWRDPRRHPVGHQQHPKTLKMRFRSSPASSGIRAQRRVERSSPASSGIWGQWQMERSLPASSGTPGHQQHRLGGRSYSDPLSTSQIALCPLQLGNFILKYLSLAIFLSASEALTVSFSG
jgi:hypothetical protein